MENPLTPKGTVAPINKVKRNSAWIAAPDQVGPWWCWPRDGRRFSVKVNMEPITGVLIIRAWTEANTLGAYLDDHPTHNRWKPRALVGQPNPRWHEFMTAAAKRIGKAGGFESGDFCAQVAASIVEHGEGDAFLKAARRGRSTHRQNLRYQILREVEKAMGDAVPRRRPDANTPDALALAKENADLLKELRQ